MVSEYEQYEIKCKKIRKQNEALLNEFASWLRKLNLKDKTIDKHVDNIDFYINAYSDETGHRFQFMPATCSDGCRPVIPIDVGRRLDGATGAGLWPRSGLGGQGFCLQFSH